MSPINPNLPVVFQQSGLASQVAEVTTRTPEVAQATLQAEAEERAARQRETVPTTEPSDAGNRIRSQADQRRRREPQGRRREAGQVKSSADAQAARRLQREAPGILDLVG